MNAKIVKFSRTCKFAREKLPKSLSPYKQMDEVTLLGFHASEPACIRISREKDLSEEKVVLT